MKKLEVEVTLPILVNDRLRTLIEEYGESEVRKAIGDMFQYEIIKELGDVYTDSIELTDIDIDQLEEILSE